MRTTTAAVIANDTPAAKEQCKILKEPIFCSQRDSTGQAEFRKENKLNTAFGTIS
jgi:hypothetical protein